MKKLFCLLLFFSAASAQKLEYVPANNTFTTGIELPDGALRLVNGSNKNVQSFIDMTKVDIQCKSEESYFWVEPSLTNQARISKAFSSNAYLAKVSYEELSNFGTKVVVFGLTRKPSDPKFTGMGLYVGIWYYGDNGLQLHICDPN